MNFKNNEQNKFKKITVKINLKYNGQNKFEG